MLNDPTRPQRLLVFDLDGVILDSRAVMESALAKSYREAGFHGPAPFDVFLEHMGRPLEDILVRMGLPLSMAPSYRATSRALAHLVRPYDHIAGALASAAAHFDAVALLTGKDRDRTIVLLERLGLICYFDMLVCGDDDFPAKPDPAPLFALMTRLGATPKTTAMVGDSPLDIACALAADVHAIGASWGFHDPVDLWTGGCDWICSDPRQLREWIEASGSVVRGLIANATRERTDLDG